MYSAIADQLHILGLSRDPSYHATRHAAAHYLNDNADAFMPFVASIHGEDMAGATDDGMMTPEGYREYCKRVEQSGDWGGEIEIQALAKYYNIPIHVIQHGPPHIISHTPVDEGSGPLTAEQAKQAGDKVVRISYHRRMYGLGEVSCATLGIGLED
jgi:OTU domain-containing protein 6